MTITLYDADVLKYSPTPAPLHFVDAGDYSPLWFKLNEMRSEIYCKWSKRFTYEDHYSSHRLLLIAPGRILNDPHQLVQGRLLHFRQVTRG